MSPANPIYDTCRMSSIPPHLFPPKSKTNDAGGTVTDEHQGLTRREMIKRGGALGGAVIWATPMVQAIGISPALAATPSYDLVARLDFVEDCGRNNGDQLNTTTLEDWTVTSGNVDVLQGGANPYGIPANLSSTCYIDLSGNTPATIVTKTVFDLGPGSYRLTAELAGHNRPTLDPLSKSTTVSIGSNSQTFTLAPTDPFGFYPQNFTGPVNVSIVIQQVAGGHTAIGNLLRSVILEQVT